VCSIIIFFAFNLTFLPQFVLGSRGMARRYFDYDPEFTGLHQASSIGAFIMGLTLVVSFGNLVYSLFKGRKAPRNPWGGSTLEWQAPSPPPVFNFYESEQPVLYPIYDYTDLVYDEEEGGYVRRPGAGKVSQ
jgi:cytochrome c oxidase subunit 1